MSQLAPLLRKKSALQIKMLDKEFSSSLIPPFHPQPDGLAGPLLLTIRGDFTINLCLGICLCILHCKECSPDQVKILDKELWFLFFEPLRFCQIPFATRSMVCPPPFLVKSLSLTLVWHSWNQARHSSTPFIFQAKLTSFSLWLWQAHSPFLKQRDDSFASVLGEEALQLQFKQAKD